jgi:hypothetical protein
MSAPARIAFDSLAVDVDAVLRAQGADPATVRSRSRKLVAHAERAVVEGAALLAPMVAQNRRGVVAVRHDQIRLDRGALLTGPLVTRELGAAQEVVAIIVTIGDRLETMVSDRMAAEPAFGLALDGFGSAAVQAIADGACERIRVEAAAAGMQTTLPLSPGMVGWDLGSGQRQIMALLGESKAPVRLTRSSLMLPRKSLSMVLGIGVEVTADGSVCDHCHLADTCRHRPPR